MISSIQQSSIDEGNEKMIKLNIGVYTLWIILHRGIEQV